MPANPAAFFQQHMLQRMQENATLRHWIAQRSPEKFARAMAILAFGAAPGSTPNGPETPGAGPSFLADGRYTSSGTGFFISPNGWLLTNQHVVGGTRSVDLRLADGAIVTAKVVKIDKKADLALLKTETRPEGWLPLSKGNATMGTTVFTIGFPHPTIQGIKPKLTEGIISSLSGMKDDDNVYQISVPVQGGNSGGPLVHQQSGWVVGVIQSKLLSGGSGDEPQNVNYAIKTSVVGDFLKSVPDALSGADPDSAESKDIIPKVESAVAMVLVNKS
jgi:S1-C subfamily serine protease